MTASPSQLSRRAGNGPSRSFKLKVAAGELTFKTLYGKQALIQSTETLNWVAEVANILRDWRFG